MEYISPHSVKSLMMLLVSGGDAIWDESVVTQELPRWLSGKESACNARDMNSVPGWEDNLEKEMTTHSSILAWKIPWTEEPGGVKSMGSQKSWLELSN